MFRPIFAAAFAVVVALPAGAQTSPTQTWPTRPVTMVVPFAAGGPMDVVGRIMATSLSEQLGQQVIVENVGGGGGMTGAARVAKAAPDGRQFVLGNVGTHAVSQSLSKNPPYNVADRFRAGGTDRRPVAGAGHAEGPASDQSAGVHRLRQGEPGQDAVRLGQRRLGDASRLRAAQRRDRRQRYPHSLSRRRAGDAGPGRRPDRLSLHRHADRDSADRRRADQGAGDPDPRALGEPAEFAVGAGAGPCRLRGGQLGARSSCPRARPTPIVAKLAAASAAATARRPCRSA